MADILIEDHAEVDALLRGLTAAFGGGDAREVLSKLDYVWARLAMHIRAEHLHLFPALLDAAEGGAAAHGAPTLENVRESVGRLREDHNFFMRELAAAVDEARAMALEEGPAEAERLGQLRERVFAVVARLAAHNRLEEEEVYLWPGTILGEAARAALGASMKREIENVPPRFSDNSSGV